MVQQVRVKEGQLLLLGILIYCIIGIILEKSTSFFLIGALIAIGINFGCSLLFWQWHADQQTYIFYGSLMFLGYYLINYYYFMLDWGFELAIVYLTYLYFLSLVNREYVDWIPKLVRNLTILTLLITRNHIVLEYIIIIILLYGLFLLEEQLQLKSNKQLINYGIHEEFYYYSDWYVVFGYIFYHYIQFDDSISFILLSVGLLAILLKYILSNHSTTFILGLIISSLLFMATQSVFLFRVRSLMGFGFTTGLIFAWILLCFASEKLHHEYFYYNWLRLFKFGIYISWIIITSIIIWNKIEIAYIILIGMGMSILLFETKAEIKSLYLNCLNVLLLLYISPLILPKIRNTLINYISLSGTQIDLLLVFIVEVVVLSAFFIGLTQKWITTTLNYRYMILLLNKLVILGFTLFYISLHSLNSTDVENYNWIQLEMALALIIVFLLMLNRNEQIRTTGLVLLIYAQFNLITVAAIHQINVLYNPTGLFRIAFLSILFISIIIINGIHSSKYNHIHICAQEIISLIVFGLGFVLTWFFIRMTGLPTETQLIYVIGALMLLKVFSSEVNLTGIYSTLAQLFWILLIIETYLAGEWINIVLYGGIGIMVFLITDIFNQANFHHLGFMLWSYPFGIMAAVFGGMYLLGNLWYISPIIGLIVGIVISVIIIKVRGGLSSKHWIGKAIFLNIWLLLLVTFYYIISENVFVIPQIIPNFNLIILIVLGVIVLISGIIFAIKSNSPTLLDIVKKNAMKAAKKVKSA